MHACPIETHTDGDNEERIGGIANAQISNEQSHGNWISKRSNSIYLRLLISNYSDEQYNSRNLHV